MRLSQTTRLLTAGLLALLGTAPLSQAGPQVPPPQFENAAQRATQLRQALAQIPAMVQELAQQRGGLAGLAYGVVIDGEPVLLGQLGHRDVASSAPVTADSVFRIASMTKSFTSLAVLKLRDAGRLNLDDPVARFVPELAGWAKPTADAGPLTIRQLLAHAGGLAEDNPYGERLIGISAKDLSAWMKQGISFSTVPGSEFEYSNLGFVLLGQVVSQASGRPYQRYITEEILRPLGMNSSYWNSAAVPKEHLALGHRKAPPGPQKFVAVPMVQDGEAGGAMGGLMLSSNDLARYIAFMLAAYPARNDAETGPVSRRTLREMQSGLGAPAITVSRPPVPGAPLGGQASSYGFGLNVVDDCRSGRMVSHGGGLPGYVSRMVWLPDRGVGVFALLNQSNASAGAVTRLLLQVLQDSGALKPRVPTASTQLMQMVRASSELIADWSDVRAQALAADALFLDTPLASRRTEITALREGLGACKPGAVKAETALRGSYRLECEKGSLDVSLTLSPTETPKIQSLDLSKDKPPRPADPACKFD
ncbi:serine hydrolase domain-containing protein [Pelomonas sp. SE-A7]|uniref:serine hydrolase domain-containing protein n=1 Tax=Pelomonas sp. SE-A7 TaxID=3054953 RepID=UPI00259D1434|nr:serine hydrolase domain-containing protein [Pelomonas sp. SE-A7]MDM4765262.1 serine hydrolase domain-containing protein [Pelomonas sp. SE-A7]